MKRLLWGILALTMAAGPSCMMMPKNWSEARGTKSDVELPPPPPVVLADEINETNSSQKFEALREEIDYDETHLPRAVTVHTVDGVK